MAEALARQRSRRGKTRDPRERELKRLKLSVCDDVGFRLYLATYDQPRQRDELIERVVKEAEAEKVRVTRLDLGQAGPETNLVGLLRAHLVSIDLPHGWRQAVMVTGIEQRLGYNRGPEGFAFLHQANLLRDALPEAAPVPVVLWLSRMASAALPAEAPDLWHWRAANFDFTGDKAPRLALLRELATHLREDEDGISTEQRRARIQMLEDLLAELEREGPPQSKRQAAERAELLMQLGNEDCRLGRAARALPSFERALQLCRETGDRPGEGAAFGNLGLVYNALGEPRRAIEFHEHALTIFQEIGDRRGASAALVGLGLLYEALREPQRAIEHYRAALGIAREIGNRRDEGLALLGLGIAYRYLGEPQQAIEYYRQAMELARETRDQTLESWALSSLGVVYASFSEPREPQRAIEHFRQALQIAREIGYRDFERTTLSALGGIYCELGEPRRAIEYYRESLEIAHETDERESEGWTLYHLSRAYSELGEPQQAMEVMREALAIAEDIGEVDLADQARAGLAEWDAERAKSETSGARVR